MKKITLLLIIFTFLTGLGLPSISAEVFDTPVDTYVMSKEDLKAQKRAEKEAQKQIKREQKEQKKREREAAKLEKKKQKALEKEQSAAKQDAEKSEESTEKKTFFGRKFFSRTEKTEGEQEDKDKLIETENSQEPSTVENKEQQPQSNKTAEEPEPNPTDVMVDSDTIEYFPERHEFEAVGHAKVIFPSEKSTLMADKIIFNHDTNYIKGYDNVVMIREGQKVFGDYVQIDLNEENALITKPVMHRMNIKIQAKDATVYDAKTEAMEGSAKFEGEGGMYKFTSRSIFGFNNPILPDAIDKEYLIKEKFEKK